MRRGFLPVKDGHLLAWSAHCAATLSSDPARFGATVADAERFAASCATFKQAMARVIPEIRTRSAVLTKDAAREALEQEARRLNALVRGSGVVNDAGLSLLGLTIHKKSYRRIGPPTEVPTVFVRSVDSNGIELQLGNGRLPADVSGAIVLYWIGDALPKDPAQWRVAATVSRARFTVPIDAPLGTKVSFYAYYLNRRGERGPLGTPTTTHALGGMRLGHRLLAA